MTVAVLSCYLLVVFGAIVPVNDDNLNKTKDPDNAPVPNEEDDEEPGRKKSYVIIIVCTFLSSLCALRKIFEILRDEDGEQKTITHNDSPLRKIAICITKDLNAVTLNESLQRARPINADEINANATYNVPVDDTEHYVLPRAKCRYPLLLHSS